MNNKGLTLIELLIVMVMLAILVATVCFVFVVTLKAWYNQNTRSDIKIDIDQGIEKMLRQLRLANAISILNDAIRFTVNERGVDNSYVYYLYNENDSWPPSYSQDSYDLMKASLLGGISGTFSYGDGVYVVRNIEPPPTSDMSASGNVVTIDLTISREDESIRQKTEVRPRNL